MSEGTAGKKKRSSKVSDCFLVASCFCNAVAFKRESLPLQNISLYQQFLYFVSSFLRQKLIVSVFMHTYFLGPRRRWRSSYPRCGRHGHSCLCQQRCDAIFGRSFCHSAWQHQIRQSQDRDQCQKRGSFYEQHSEQQTCRRADASGGHSQPRIDLQHSVQ